MIGWNPSCWSEVLDSGWSLHPPVDPYGDGYIAHLRAELRDEGLYAKTIVTINRQADGEGDLAAFLASLADDWRGWRGSRIWHALEHEMSVAGVHDGRGHVSLEVTLRRPNGAFADDAWSARSVFVLEAGEEMTTLARDIESLLAQPPGNYR